MKIPYFLILAACAGNVYAEAPRLLPPVLDNSTYSDTEAAPQAPAQQSTPSYDGTDNLDKVKTDISELKSKIQQQEEAINYLKRTNADLQQKLSGGNKSPAEVSKPSTAGTPPALNTTASTASAKSVAGTGSEKERYQRGSALLKKGDYAQAQKEFEGILKTYPKGEYADNAQYWIGVALLNRGDKKAALQAFDRVARAYPKSEKAPEALYKLADTLLIMKNKSKAKEYFDYVIQTYPGTNGAKLAAKKKAAEKL